MLVNFIRNLSRNTVSKMGRGRKVIYNKRGRPPKNLESIIDAPSLSALGDLDKLERGESLKEPFIINNANIEYRAYLVKNGDTKEIGGKNEEELNKYIEKWKEKGYTVAERLKKGQEVLYYNDKKIDYNQFYTMNAPVGETEKAFKIGVKVTKRGIANGLSSSLYRRLKDQDIAQTAFVPKSATRLVTKNGKKYFQVKGWILDKIRKEKIEYWNNRFNEYYSAGLNFNDD